MMEIITRKQAIERGITVFFTGRPCKYGHIDVRALPSGNCRECIRIHGRLWYRKNLDYKLNKSKEVYDRNRNDIISRTKQYKKDNPEAALKWARQWRKNNPEKAYQSCEKNRKKNLAKYAVYGRNARAKRANVLGTHSKEDITARLKWQNGRCAVYNRDIANGYEVDHYKPIILGGDNWPSNLQLTCRACNRKKHGKDPIDFYRSQGFLL